MPKYFLIFCLWLLVFPIENVQGQLTPSAQLDKARSLLMEESFQSAYDMLAVLQKRQPYHPEVHYLKGLAEIHLKKYKDAVQSFSWVASAFPNSEHVYYYRSLAHFHQKQYELATSDIRKALEIKPTDQDVQFLYALLAYEVNNYQVCLERIAPLLNLREAPNTPDPFLLAAAAYEGADSLDAVLNIMNKANDYFPKQPEILSRIGLIQLQLNHPDTAKDFIEKALAVNNQHLFSLYCLAEWHYQQGNQRELRNAYRRYLTQAPLSGLALYHLGSSYASENLDSAIHYLKKAQQVAPNKANIPYNMGVAYLHAGKKQEALNAFNEALVIFPYHPPTLDALKGIYREHGITEGVEYINGLERFLNSHHDSLKADSGFQVLLEESMVFQPDFYKDWNAATGRTAPSTASNFLGFIPAGEQNIEQFKKDGGYATEFSEDTLFSAPIFMGEIQRDSTFLKKLLPKTPMDSALWLFGQHRLSDAEDLLSKYILKHPVAPYYHFFRAIVSYEIYNVFKQFETSQDAKVDQQRLEFILRDLVLETQIKPNFPLSYYNAGVLYKQLGHLDKAEQYFKLGLEYDTTVYPAWHQLGLIYHKNQSIDSACEAWRKASKGGYLLSEQAIQAICP